MDKIQLKATKREIKPTKLKKLRKSGYIPAVLYGHNLANQSLAILQSDFEKALKKAGESTIVELLTEDGKTHPVLIHDVQHHYLNSQPIHVDFYEVSMSEKLKAEVALEYTGESKAVKELGGVLVKVLNAIEVQCLPADLPHNIEANISALRTISDVIHVRDLKVSSKVEILTPAEEVVAKVQPPRDVEKELSETLVTEDLSKVEGIAEQPAAEADGEAAKKEETKKE